MRSCISCRRTWLGVSLQVLRTPERAASAQPTNGEIVADLGPRSSDRECHVGGSRKRWRASRRRLRVGSLAWRRSLKFLPRPIHKAALANCNSERMVIAASRLELLQTTLAGHRVLPYSDALAVTCFDFGISLAQTGADLPDWLATAPQWVRATVVIGRSATLRAIQEDRLLTPAPPALSVTGTSPSAALAVAGQRFINWGRRMRVRPSSCSVVEVGR